MDRKIEITVVLKDASDKSPTGEEIVQQLRDDFCDAGIEAEITLKSELDS